MAAQKGIGRLVQFGIAKETSRGTPEAAATYWIPWQELSVEEKHQDAIDEQSVGVIEDSVGKSIVKEWAEVSLKAPIADKHFGLILYATLGSKSVATHSGETIVYDHTFTVAQSAQHPALSFFVDDPLAAQDYKHALGMVESLEINYETGKFLDYSLALRGKKGATATLTPATTTENRFLPKHATFKVASAYSGLNAASAFSIKSLKLKISKNIEDDDALGNSGPADIVNKQLTIEGSLEAIYKDETDFKTAYLAGTAKALRIDLKNTDVTLGSAANPQVRIDLAKVTFTELTKPFRLNDLVYQTVTFKAHYSITDSLMISALVTNLEASY
jgi:hypothetical protein